jgi:hypothetical protein
MMEIKRDEIEKWSSQKKIDDALQSAGMMTGVGSMRAARVWVCVVRVVWYAVSRACCADRSNSDSQWR